MPLHGGLWRYETPANDEDDADAEYNFYGAVTLQHMSLPGLLDKDHVTCQRYAL